MDQSGTMRGASVSLQGVRLRYGELVAVDGVNLHIEPGELCCLLGPSGCGKSTTLRIIAGLEHPDSGTVSINGHDVTSLPARSRGLGLVFQNYALFPHMTVFDNVAYGLRCHKIPKDRTRNEVLEALQMVRLDGYENRFPHELSGGEQQRVALARCLVIQPQALLLDEPFSNLDARLRILLRDELLKLQRSLGLTTIFVTHDQEEAMTLADRIVLMRKGRIVQTGSPRKLYERPQTLFAASFLGKMNLLHPTQQGEKATVLNTTFREGFPSGYVAGVRPEHLRLAKSGSGVPAVVEEALLTGPMIRYRLRLADGSEIEAERPSFEPAYARGDELRLSVEKRHVLQLQPDERRQQQKR